MAGSGWAWIAADLIWLVPIAAVVTSFVLAGRWGWRTLVVTSVLWAAVGAVLSELLSVGSSASDALAIALFVFLVPSLICGALALVIQRRTSQRA
jgi:hypothetical protein